jgi:hypothetical protein
MDLEEAIYEELKQETYQLFKTTLMSFPYYYCRLDAFDLRSFSNLLYGLQSVFSYRLATTFKEMNCTVRRVISERNKDEVMNFCRRWFTNEEIKMIKSFIDKGLSCDDVVVSIEWNYWEFGFVIFKVMYKNGMGEKEKLILELIPKSFVSLLKEGVARGMFKDYIDSCFVETCIFVKEFLNLKE